MNETRTGGREEREWQGDEFASRDSVSGSRIVTDGIQIKLGMYLCRLLFGNGYEPINIGIRYHGVVINLGMAKLRFLSVQEAVLSG
jgi:hypothetical protein